MSLSASLHSYFTIIKKIKTSSFPSKAELKKQVEKALEDLREKDNMAEKGMSDRSFERAKRDIKNLFGINITYSTKNRGYYIAESDVQDRFLQAIAESYDVLQMLQSGPDWQAFIQPENHKTKGTEHFPEIVYAIRHRLQLQFTYHKFWEEETTERTVAPYLLKEAGQRWYLLAKDVGGNGFVKNFALDRMTNVLALQQSFTPPANKSYLSIYQHTFGIDGPHNEDEKPQEIVLSFDHYQGKYVKALPLHHSQQTLIDDEKELRIRLYLYITFDFKMQLLSYGEKVKVLQPASLVNELKIELQNTLEQYT